MKSLVIGVMLFRLAALVGCSSAEGPSATASGAATLADAQAFYAIQALPLQVREKLFAQIGAMTPVQFYQYLHDRILPGHSTNDEAASQDFATLEPLAAAVGLRFKTVADLWRSMGIDMVNISLAEYQRLAHGPAAAAAFLALGGVLSYSPVATPNAYCASVNQTIQRLFSVGASDVAVAVNTVAMTGERANVAKNPRIFVHPNQFYGPMLNYQEGRRIVTRYDYVSQCMQTSEAFIVQQPDGGYSIATRLTN